MLDLLDNAVLQGLSYGLAVLGIALAFRALRFPDLTADGSFLLGATVFAATLQAELPGTVALAAAVFAGMMAGAVTAALHFCAGVNRLLAGILTSMIGYSVGFRVLQGRAMVNVDRDATALGLPMAFDGVGGLHPVTIGVLGLTAIIAAGLLRGLLATDFGLAMRGAGQHEALMRDFGKSPPAYLAWGLMLANGLVALAGVCVVSREGYANANMGVGIVLVLVASLVMGEHLVRLNRFFRQRHLARLVVSPFVGCVVYYLLYLITLRAGLRGWLPFTLGPTDLKALSAVVIVVMVAVRHRHAQQAPDDSLPL